MIRGFVSYSPRRTTANWSFIGSMTRASSRWTFSQVDRARGKLSPDVLFKLCHDHSSPFSWYSAFLDWSCRNFGTSPPNIMWHVTTKRILGVSEILSKTNRKLAATFPNLQSPFLTQPSKETLEGPFFSGHSYFLFASLKYHFWPTFNPTLSLFQNSGKLVFL